jgi:hypothetical protein
MNFQFVSFAVLLAFAAGCASTGGSGHLIKLFNGQNFDG